jgi:hypothetical protein
MSVGFVRPQLTMVCMARMATLGAVAARFAPQLAHTATIMGPLGFPHRKAKQKDLQVGGRRRGGHQLANARPNCFQEVVFLFHRIAPCLAK